MTGPNGLTLQEDMAAQLQARMSWPQAEACAADLIMMFGRRMRDFPLTCEHCKSAPATHLLAADISVGRVTQLTCGACGQRGIKDAGEIARAASAVWLFALIPAGKGTDR